MSNNAPAPTETPKRSRRGLILVATVTLVLLLGGGGAAYWMLAGGPADGEAATSADEHEGTGPGAAVPLDAFVVNLADPGGNRFLRVTLSLVVQDETHAMEMGENEITKMRVRSAILELLALQTADRLITPEGKTELKKAIAEGTAQAVEGLHISDVLFSEFVVQF